MHANNRKDIDEVRTGDIAAVVAVKNTTTGDTFADEKNPVILESMEFPEPVIRVAIEPKTRAGQEKMMDALMKLAEEDPTFRTYTDEETGQVIIAGMGELHLEIIVTDFSVNSRSKPTSVLRRSLTRRLSARRSSRIPSSRVRPAVTVSTVMLLSRSSRMNPARASSLSTPSQAVSFRRNISRQSKPVSEAQWRAAFSPATT